MNTRDEFHQWKIEQLTVERDSAMREASDLAMSIWRSEFRNESPDFELCDSISGIISQIDNMYAGIRNQRDALQAQFEALKFNMSEHERLHNELNVVLHPNGDGPQAPSLCDLVSYVKTDLQAMSAQVEASNRAIISIRARCSISHNLTIQLMQGAELNSSDWDYISEAQVAEIEQHLASIEAQILEREAIAIMRAPFEQPLTLTAEQLAVFRRIADDMRARAAALRNGSDV